MAPRPVTEHASATLRTVQDLIDHGLADAADRTGLDAVAARYAVAITPAMAHLIDVADAADPIARQFVPAPAELRTTPGEHSDPIGDRAHEVQPGLIHRYPDRVLLKLTHTCPVYCRFCFRREVVGQSLAGSNANGASQAAQSTDQFDAALGYIAANPAIFEVILSGGDPLILSSRRIAEVTRRLAAIPHVRVLRWHSRVPVVTPERITDDLIAALRTSAIGKAVYIGVHVNHPRELADAARSALARLADNGIVLLSQTVLLRGINDNAEILAELYRDLLALRVRPYYLHHLDAAPGTSHFRVPVSEGQAIMRALRGRLSGLAQPTYVIDIPGGHGKVPIGPAYQAADGRSVLDSIGILHRLD